VAAPDAHVARAESNEALATSLEADGEYNWAVTVAFYAALHWVSALLAREGADTEGLDHATTEYKLDLRHGAITARYLSLKGMSVRARYFPEHLADPDDCRRARKLLAQIRDYAERVIAGQVPGR
jgi:hypothetical protein